MNNTFYKDIVNNLKKEAKELNNKLSNVRQKMDRTNYNLYIAILKSLRETLKLIQEYDWQLMYSEYGYKDENDNIMTEISIWEQNHDGQIRNHKHWKTNIPYKTTQFDLHKNETD